MRPKTMEWQGVRDSNPRVRDRESRALGLTWLTPLVR
jgi:hypothetical protein